MPQDSSSSGFDPVLRPHMPELDTLRGIAVLGVLVVHAFAHSYPEVTGGVFGQFMRVTSLGRLGVNLFFVLSGFLITGILLDSKARTDYYRRFYYRRVLRILPPYFAIIVAVTLTGGSWKFALLSSIFLANLTTLFGVVADYAPLWSLAVEEHFYLIWPTVVRHLRVRTVTICASFLLILVPVLRYLGFGGQVPFGATWYNCDALALGALVQIAIRRWPERRLLAGASVACAVLSIATMGVLAHMNLIESRTVTGFTCQSSLWNLIFAATLTLTLVVGSSPWRKFVTPRALMFVGYISYGLYLFHLLVYKAYDAAISYFLPSVARTAVLPTQMFLRFVLAGSLSILIAFVSRRYFEERFLRLKDSAPRFLRGEIPAAVPVQD